MRAWAGHWRIIGASGVVAFVTGLQAAMAQPAPQQGRPRPEVASPARPAPERPANSTAALLSGRTLVYQAFPRRAPDVYVPMYFSPDGRVYNNSWRGQPWRPGERGDVCFTMDRPYCLTIVQEGGRTLARWSDGDVAQVQRIIEGNPYFPEAGQVQPVDPRYFFGDWIAGRGAEMQMMRITQTEMSFLTARQWGDVKGFRVGDRLPITSFRQVEDGIAPVLDERAHRDAWRFGHARYVRRDVSDMQLRGLPNPRGLTNMFLDFRRADLRACQASAARLEQANAILDDPSRVAFEFSAIIRQVNQLEIAAGDMGESEIQALARSTLSLLTGGISSLFQREPTGSDRTLVRMKRDLQNIRRRNNYVTSALLGVAKAAELYFILQEAEDLLRRLEPTFSAIEQAISQYEASVGALNEGGCFEFVGPDERRLELRVRTPAGLVDPANYIQKDLVPNGARQRQQPRRS